MHPLRIEGGGGPTPRPLKIFVFFFNVIVHTVTRGKNILKSFARVSVKMYLIIFLDTEIYFYP